MDLPLVVAHDGEFKGSEYLGLYPTIERDSMLRPAVRSDAGLRPLVGIR